ncbi:MAG TPA: hypothetical protein VG603_02170, partial [Chitinophagales bacterium]|nr:hypothetical protein [Chitinophagales bacterium]
VVIAWSVLVSLLSRNLQPGLKFKNLALTFTPYYLYGIFLLVQKQQNGWYFFPYHIDSVSFDPLRFKTGFNEFFNFVFWDHGRYWCEKILLIAGVFALLKGYFSVNKLRHSFLLLGGVFVLAFLMFSSLTFFMERYSLCLFPLQFIAVALAILSFSRNKIYIAVVTGFLCYTATTHFESHSFRNDSDLGYRHEVHTLQQAVEYVGAVAKPGEKVYGNFPAYFATGFKPGGYQNGFTLDAAVNFGAHPRYIIVSDPGTPLDKDFGQYNIQVLQTFVDGYAKAEVWRITPKDSLAR